LRVGGIAVLAEIGPRGAALPLRPRSKPEQKIGKRIAGAVRIQRILV
jgi:hypothetical protein